MAQRIVVIGASAGGIDALRSLVGQLPHDLNAAIFCRAASFPESSQLLSRDPDTVRRVTCTLSRRRGSHPAVTDLRSPPDRHLLIEQGRIRLNCGAKVNRARPAIDPLFWTAAETYGQRVIGIVMTGVLDDGTAGLAAIKTRGGIAVVQDPEEAQFPDMPKSARKAVEVDYCLPIAGIAELLANPEQVKVKMSFPASPEVLALEAQISLQGTADIPTLNHLGKPSVYSCPDCHGVLWEIQDGKLLRNRCQTGMRIAPECYWCPRSKTKMMSYGRSCGPWRKLNPRSGDRYQRFQADFPADKRPPCQYPPCFDEKEPMASAIRGHKTGPEQS